MCLTYVSDVYSVVTMVIEPINEFIMSSVIYVIISFDSFIHYCSYYINWHIKLYIVYEGGDIFIPLVFHNSHANL